MSYPFGSGMPYPSSNSAPYPPQPPQSNFAPPYPTQTNAPYPPAQPPSTNYPPYPQMPAAPFGAGDGYSPYQQQSSHMPSYPSTNPTGGYPSGGVGGMPGYPQHQHQHQQQQPYGGYPGQNQYPPSNGGAPFGAGYPNAPSSQQSSPYPSAHIHTSPYPPQNNPNMPPPSSMHSPYPNSHNNSSSSSGYTSGGSSTGSHHRGGSGYGAAATNMANCFSEMQSHIKDTRKENKSKGTPTLISSPNFDPIADAKALRKAMKGFGTDEDALINVICRRNNEQRQIIQREYKTNFGKDLIEDIKSETTGNFENLLVALLAPIVNFYVKELHDAMSGIGTDEDVLVEILCSMTNYEIHTIKNAYERLYGKNLESELMSETSGNFKRLLVSLCTAARDESGATNIEAARRDATELLNAGELRVGTDESTFNMVLCQRNYAQIKLICEEYERMTGHTLEKAIKREFSGDIMDGLIAIIQCTSNKAAFFASRLHKSMAGIGTNDNQLIRLIVTRCEIDLADIKTTFESMYGKSLKSWIKGDTSGHYKHALYALIGEQRSS